MAELRMAEWSVNRIGGGFRVPASAGIPCVRCAPRPLTLKRRDGRPPHPAPAYPARVAALARAPFALRKGRENGVLCFSLGSRFRGNDGVRRGNDGDWRLLVFRGGRLRLFGRLGGGRRCLSRR